MLKIVINDKSIIWSIQGNSTIESGSIPIKSKKALESLNDDQIIKLITHRLNQYWQVNRYFHNYKIIKK